MPWFLGKWQVFNKLTNKGNPGQSRFYPHAKFDVSIPYRVATNVYIVTKKKNENIWKSTAVYFFPCHALEKNERFRASFCLTWINVMTEV